jgi:hypothetical protein
MWYKVEIIYIEKWKKNLYCNDFFYLNSNKKLLIWYKKRKKKKLIMFWNLYVLEEVKIREKKWRWLLDGAKIYFVLVKQLSYWLIFIKYKRRVLLDMWDSHLWVSHPICYGCAIIVHMSIVQKYMRSTCMNFTPNISWLWT